MYLLIDFHAFSFQNCNLELKGFLSVTIFQRKLLASFQGHILTRLNVTWSGRRHISENQKIRKYENMKIWKYENAKIIFMRFVRMTGTCLEEEWHILEILLKKKKKYSHCKFRKESKNNNKRLLCFNSGSIYNTVKVENQYFQKYHDYK